MNARLERLRARAITLPTDPAPEADGTLEWSTTTMVLVECHAGGISGFGYSYVHESAAKLIEGLLAPALQGQDSLALGALHARMARAVRNQGRDGMSAMAIAAVDVALWDLKARMLGLPLAVLLGQARGEVPVYASAGFATSSPDEIRHELAAYRAQGLQHVKMKIGRDARADHARLRAARDALGPDIALMVDANGAYDRKQALQMAEHMAELGVVWFEEPVSSDDLEGLHFLRERAPASMQIAAGEYGYNATYFRRMLQAQAVDVLQVDATRCAGVTGFLRADALCEAFGVPLSTHCAPTLHCHLAAAATRTQHLEYFHDHVRMEQLLFEHTPPLVAGALRFDHARPGLGITPRDEEIARHAA